MSTITNKLLNKETQEREKNGPLCPNDFHLECRIVRRSLKNMLTRSTPQSQLWAYRDLEAKHILPISMAAQKSGEWQR